MQIRQQSTACAYYIKVTVRVILLATHITVLTLYEKIHNEMTYIICCLLTDECITSNKETSVYEILNTEKKRTGLVEKNNQSVPG